MNKIWQIVVIIALIMLCIINPSSILPSLLLGSEKALNLSMELLFIYALWLGIIGIIENTPIANLLSKLLSPVINFFWGKNLPKEAKKNISLSISTSLLGLGNASIPLGIKAVEELDDKSGTITFPIIMTIVFASSGLQFLPTTILSLMSAYGSSSPEFIILPTLLSSLTTFFVGAFLALAINYFLKKSANKGKSISKEKK